jgi:hypothetical protein
MAMDVHWNKGNWPSLVRRPQMPRVQEGACSWRSGRTEHSMPDGIGRLRVGVGRVPEAEASENDVEAGLSSWSWQRTRGGGK